MGPRRHDAQASGRNSHPRELPMWTVPPRIRIVASMQFKNRCQATLSLIRWTRPISLQDLQFGKRVAWHRFSYQDVLVAAQVALE